MGAFLPGMTQRMTTGVYDLANVGFTGVSVVTNTVSTTAYRGAGRPEAAVAIERMVDRFAAEIGMDPAEVRRRNLVPRFLEPLHHRHRHALRRRRLPGGPATGAASRRLRRAAGRAAPAPRAPATRWRSASASASTSRSPPARRGTEFGAVELLDGGRLRVRSGATPYGQGHDTTWAMIVADRTGVPMDDIEVVHGDTDLVPLGRAHRRLPVGAAGRRGDRRAPRPSWSTRPASGPPSCWRPRSTTSCSTRRRPLPRRRHAGPAARLGRRWPHGHAPGPLAAEDGLRGADADVPVRRPRRRRRGRHRDRPGPAAAASSRSTTPARLLNPLLAEGQVHGGIAQGVAQALLEEIRYDEDGKPEHHQLRRLPRDLGRRAAVLRARAHGDADLRQRARRQGRRRVGHDRLDPGRARTPSSTPSPTSASATSRRRSRRSGSGPAVQAATGSPVA